MVYPIQFFVQGTPKGQPRPRAFAAGGKARVYQPGTAEGWKSQVAMFARDHIPEAPLSGPIRVDIDFFFKRPKAHFGRSKGEPYLRPDAPFFHSSKPDRDNLDKAILDTLTTLGFWHDDAQVVGGFLRKFYGHEGAKITVSQVRTLADLEV